MAAVASVEGPGGCQPEAAIFLVLLFQSSCQPCFVQLVAVLVQLHLQEQWFLHRS
jgi:hypothetical protein